MSDQRGAKYIKLLRVNPCALSVMLAFAASAPVHAFQFKAGDVAGSFDTTVSLGGSWRMQGRDPALVGIANGGTARTVNEDDGNLNFDKNDLYSAIVKATHELDVSYRNYGLFARATYFFDKKADDNAAFGTAAHNRTASDAKFLDAFVRGKFDLGGKTLNVRLGNQVISWGESTFIPNGINIINPVDVTKLRTPGAELKEALTPSPIIWGSQQLTDTATLEAFWIAHFSKTKIDPRGTFFSSNDFISDDGDKAFAGFGRRKDQHTPFTSPLADPTAAVWLPRANDRDPKDQRKQFGVAFRYVAEALNNAELGFYYVNYHSRTPLVSAIRGTTTNVLNAPAGGGTARYFAEFPENIRLYGASFSVLGPAGVALQGEYSYRPNQPLQLASVELLLGALGLANNITGSAAAAAAVPVGSEISGFRRVDMHQAQLTGTKAFGPTLGAQQFSLLGEVGFTYLKLPSGLLFAGPGAALPAPGSANAAGGSFQTEGFATTTSWGYRVLGRLDYENAIGPIGVSPRIAFSHDVRGVSPTFNHGTKALTLGVGFNYLQKWQADISYTNFFGGRTYSGTDTAAPPAGQSASFATSANPLKDRDFIAVSVSYSF